MATKTNLTFPGVYTQIIDQSFIPPAQSPFLPGLIGAASKGPFDTPTLVNSLKDFIQRFGKPLTTNYDTSGNPVGAGFFLADSIGIIAPFANAITVVRVGNQYAPLATANGSGTAGSYLLGTSVAQSIQLNPVGADVFVRVVEAGKDSTVNAKVISAGNGTVTLDSTGIALQASYVSATISFSHFQDAANQAESVLYAYSYGTSSSSVPDASLSQYGTVSGTKNNFYFTVQSAGTLISAGDVYKVMETAKATTSEVRVKSVVGNTIYLETSDFTRVGYQALALQDNYVSASLFKATGAVPFLYLLATEAGDWANGTFSTQGLYVKVRPGSQPGTKKFEIYRDAALVEVFDSLSDDPTNARYYTTAINGISQFIFIQHVYGIGGNQLFHAANTVNPWDTAYYAINLAASPPTMPDGAVNAGTVTIPPNTTTNTGGQFEDGFNGENVQDSDLIGTVNPTDDSNTGLKSFLDENVTINILAAPMNSISMSVQQEMARVAGLANAFAISDVPNGLSARQAIDWHDGVGQYLGRGKIDNHNIGVYWNWIQITDQFSGLLKFVPPTVGTLRCMAYTFSADFPWYAAAGENRGALPEVSAVQFPRVSDDVKQAMYGHGESINPILWLRGSAKLYGERTLQRAESKLTAVHSVILVNYIVSGLAVIGRRFVFEPNDNDLLVLIRLAFTQFLNGVKNQRGVEDFNLVVDSTNNTPDTRNRREVIVDLSIIPTDVAERIFINCTVRESGASLNSVQA